jgi:hypothetical protein
VFDINKRSVCILFYICPIYNLVPPNKHAI